MKIKVLAIVLAAVLAFPLQSIAASASETRAEEYGQMKGIIESESMVLEKDNPDIDGTVTTELGSDKRDIDIEVNNDTGEEIEIYLSNNETDADMQTNIDDLESSTQSSNAESDENSKEFYRILEKLQNKVTIPIEVENSILDKVANSIKIEEPSLDRDYTSFLESEPNDGVGLADVIDDNITSSKRYIVQGYINRNYSDLDTYRFTIKTKALITMVGKWAGEFYNANYEEDLIFGIFDANDNILYASNATYIDGKMSSVLSQTLSPGTYYIHVLQGRDKDNFFVGKSYLLGVDFEITPPNSKQFVTRLYEKVLNRAPDSSGLAFHANSLNSHLTTGADAAKGFVFSTEVTNKNLSNTAFIQMLYQAFMGRAADSDGLSYWRNMLENGVSREFVFKGFAESTEFTNICYSYGITRGDVKLTAPRDQNADLTMFISRCYGKALGRTADIEGLNYYAQEILLKRVTPVQASQNFIFSPEFKNKNLSNADFVKVLYRTFMGREFDQSGLNYHLNRMKNGTSREEILLGFAYAPEFKTIMSGFGL